MKNSKFYQLEVSGKEAIINIYGNITCCPWESLGEVSANNLKKEIDGLSVDTINVYINSYGGEVAEALAIHAALQRHPAEVHTYIDGFACSAATIIFCAGAKRTVSKLGLMMIHNCMSYAGYANTEELMKLAEDNEKINTRSIEAYKAVANIPEDDIKAMMDRETWLTAEECLQYGFATDIADEDEEDGAQQSAFAPIHNIIMEHSGKREQGILQEILTIVQGLEKNAPQQKQDPEGEPVPEPEQTPLQKLLGAFKED